MLADGKDLCIIRSTEDCSLEEPILMSSLVSFSMSKAKLACRRGVFFFLFFLYEVLSKCCHLCKHLII